MSDFTIKVFSGDGDPITPTEIGIVGNQLRNLAAEFPQLNNDTNIAIHRSSTLADYSSQKGSWTSNAQDAAEAIFDALSFVIWNGNTIQKVHDFNEPANVKKVHDHIKLIFIFEEEGQMVVPVPSTKQIERGETSAPLNLPDVYDQLVSVKTVRELNRRLRAAKAGGTNTVLSSLTEPQLAAVETELQLAGEAMRTEANAVDTFYAQLGDYSVRQCHS